MEYFAFILLSLAILLLMVLIHEAGHYTTAKILGFTVDEFSVGFGPKLFSRRRKNGELFSLRALPLGGYCAFYGETDDDDDKDEPDKKETDGNNANVNAVTAADENAAAPSEKIDTENASGVNACDNDTSIADDKTDKAESGKDDDLLTYVMRSKPEYDAEKNAKAESEEIKPRLDKNGNPALTFNAQKPWKRIIVLFGGVFFNFLSAIIFSLIYIGAVGFPVPQITEVYYVDPETKLVKYNDFEIGDRIIAVDGEKITVLRSYDDIMNDIGNKKSVKFRVLRKGKSVDIVAERKQINLPDSKTKPYMGFGFSMQNVFTGNTAGNAFKYCVPYTFKLSWAILGSFGDILTGKQAITNMTGPVGSISFMAEVSIADWRNILILLPLLASNLAIFNILPFPALDGAHVVFTVIEWIRKKPIKRKVENMIHFVGMVVLLLFVLVVDILSFAL